MYKDNIEENDGIDRVKKDPAILYKPKMKLSYPNKLLSLDPKISCRSRTLSELNSLRSEINDSS